MKPLEPPDNLHLQAAQGWLEPGNAVEANEELERITPGLRVHPDVLELRWQVFAKAQHWDACLHVSEAIIQLLASGRCLTDRFSCHPSGAVLSLEL